MQRPQRGTDWRYRWPKRCHKVVAWFPTHNRRSPSQFHLVAVYNSSQIAALDELRFHMHKAMDAD